MHAHARALSVVIDQTAVRCTLEPCQIVPQSQHGRWNWRPIHTAGMLAGIAISGTICVPSNGSGRGHAHGHRLAICCFGREERRRFDHVSNIGYQPCLPGGIQIRLVNIKSAHSQVYGRFPSDKCNFAILRPVRTVAASIHPPYIRRSAHKFVRKSMRGVDAETGRRLVSSP